MEKIQQHNLAYALLYNLYTDNNLTSGVSKQRYFNAELKNRLKQPQLKHLKKWLRDCLHAVRAGTPGEHILEDVLSQRIQEQRDTSEGITDAELFYDLMGDLSAKFGISIVTKEFDQLRTEIEQGRMKTLLISSVDFDNAICDQTNNFFLPLAASLNCISSAVRDKVIAYLSSDNCPLEVYIAPLADTRSLQIVLYSSHTLQLTPQERHQQRLEFALNDGDQRVRDCLSKNYLSLYQHLNDVGIDVRYHQMGTGSEATGNCAMVDWHSDLVSFDYFGDQLEPVTICLSKELSESTDLNDILIRSGLQLEEVLLFSDESRGYVIGPN